MVGAGWSRLRPAVSLGSWVEQDTRRNCVGVGKEELCGWDKRVEGE